MEAGNGGFEVVREGVAPREGHHLIAGPVLPDLCAHLHHGAAAFVSQVERQRDLLGYLPAIHRLVRTADAGQMGLDKHLVLGEYQLSFHQNDLPRLAKLRSTRLHFFSPIKNNYPVSRRDTERGASCNDGLLCRFYRSTDPVFPSLSDRNMGLERFDHTERGLACQGLPRNRPRRECILSALPDVPATGQGRNRQGRSSGGEADPEHFRHTTADGQSLAVSDGAAVCARGFSVQVLLQASHRRPLMTELRCSAARSPGPGRS